MTRIVLSLAAVALAFPTAAQALDTAPWQRVLSAHAKNNGFDYRGLAADDERMADLRTFVASVGAMDDDEPLASWLNAYNVLVVQAVVTRAPIRSVRDVDGFFDTVRHRVAGRSRTLDDVENRVIRPRFRDARIHFALNCGARSCPNLYRRAFATQNLDATLDRLARRAVGSDRHVRITESGLQISEIFFWFREDFERDAETLPAWIHRFGGDRLADVPADAPLTRLRYNWRLNASH